MRALAPAALLACAALAGCGGAGGAPATAPATSTAPAAGDRITIEEPSDGQALRGRAAAGGGLRLRVPVRGRGRPGGTVFLSAGCRPRPCTARARVGGDGRWMARIELTTPAAGRFVTIDANAREQVVAAGSAVVTVQLVGAARALRRDAAGARTTPRAPAARRGAAVPPALAHEVLVIGDSLAEGMAAPLRAALPGWRVTIDALTSRPLATGMAILAARRSAPAILAFSLFTNDDPRGSGALEAAVRASAGRPGGCAVWATIAAPPVKGVDYGAANTLLRSLATDPELAPSLRIVDWSAAIAASPSLLAGDGVHATPAGYTARAGLYASAIKACAGGR